MRKALLALFAAALLLTGLLQAPAAFEARAQAPKKEPAKKDAPPAPLKIKVGSVAPDFTLLAFDGKELKKVSLRDYRGKKNVALAFYVFAFTGG